MYRFIAITILFFALSAHAQNIDVKSFRCLEKDMDARIKYPVTDKNAMLQPYQSSDHRNRL
jgi:hypothetical protein